eukprot:TRINITY_DN19671_c0_g2_i1.p1 TRINITY_DN19671_c0_g2~~TRINITY_DN19671_c0_g2_i1.p1  ORF type:complete len:387 (-),score=58.48 TRINITY_DN19671_c0_g2_i1:57-1217(-)
MLRASRTPKHAKDLASPAQSFRAAAAGNLVCRGGQAAKASPVTYASKAASSPPGTPCRTRGGLARKGRTDCSTQTEPWLPLAALPSGGLAPTVAAEEQACSAEMSPMTDRVALKAARLNTTDLSLGLNSLDPSTWPVLASRSPSPTGAPEVSSRDALAGWASPASVNLAARGQVSTVATVPEEGSLTSDRSPCCPDKALEDSLQLRRLCLDLVTLAREVDGDIGCEATEDAELLTNARLSLDVLARCLSRPRAEGAKPQEEKITPGASSRSAPASEPDAGIRAGSIQEAAPRVPLLALWGAPSPVANLTCWGTASQCTKIPPQCCWQPSTPRLPSRASDACQGQLQHRRSRSVSVTRRRFRQCWVLECEEHFVLESPPGVGSSRPS